MTDRTKRHLWAAKVYYKNGDMDWLTGMFGRIIVTTTKDKLIQEQTYKDVKHFKKITLVKFYPCKRPEFGSL